MEIIDCIQGEAEWKKHRLWKITWTKLKAVFSASSTQTYKTLMDELICEDLAPPIEIFVNDAMMRWTLLETPAREEYEKVTWQKVDEIWFILHDEMKYVGLSADWLVKNKEWVYDHGVEIKCMWPKNHLKAIMQNTILPEHKAQIINYFLVCETLETLSYVLYNPDMYIEELQLHIINVKRSDFEKDLKAIVPKLIEFRKTWKENILQLTSKKWQI